MLQEPTLPCRVQWLSGVIVGDSLYFELSTTTPIRLDIQLNLVERDSEVQRVVCSRSLRVADSITGTPRGFGTRGCDAQLVDDLRHVRQAKAHQGRQGILRIGCPRTSFTVSGVVTAAIGESVSWVRRFDARVTITVVGLGVRWTVAQAVRVHTLFVTRVRMPDMPFELKKACPPVFFANDSAVKRVEETLCNSAFI